MGLSNLRGIKEKKSTRSGFTAIELLVWIAIVVVLQEILTRGKIKTASVDEVQIEANTGETYFNLSTEVEMQCVYRGGWVTSIDLDDIGFIQLPSGERLNLEVKNELRADEGMTTSSEEHEHVQAQTLPIGDCQIVDGHQECSTGATIAYHFSDYSGKCSATVSAWVPRSKMFTSIGGGVWRANEAILYLNLKAELLNEQALQDYLDSLDEATRAIIVLLLGQGHAQTSFSRPTQWTISAPFAGVLVGSGIGGSDETSGAALQLGLTQPPVDPQGGNGFMGGCSLQSIEPDANLSFLSFVCLALGALVTVIYRQRSQIVSVRTGKRAS